MPSLIITSQTPNGWVARIANTEVEWVFAGADAGPEIQYLCVRDFARFMGDGDMPRACLAGIEGATDANVGDIAATLLTTDALEFEGATLFTAATVGSETLAECVLEAGEALIAVI
jgi:hypothetical protein